MQTETAVIRSRRNLNVGDVVEGRKILSKTIIAPHDDKAKRFGVYDYTVDVTKIVAEPKRKISPGTRVNLSDSPMVTFARFGR
jgi:hypothetical protein